VGSTIPPITRSPFDDLDLSRTVFVSIADTIRRDPSFNRNDYEEVRKAAEGYWVASERELDGRQGLVVTDGDTVLDVFIISANATIIKKWEPTDRFKKAKFELLGPEEWGHQTLRGLQLPPQLRRKRGQIRGIWFPG
jgi:hypothetical protein